MKKVILLSLFLLALAARVCGADSIVNDPTTGTQLNELVKLTGASTAIVTSAGDTSGAIGVCVSGCGTSGSPIVQVVGYGTCVFDGPTIANDYVQISASIKGNCTDAGASPPVSGQVIGRVLFTHASGGAFGVSLTIDRGDVGSTGPAGPTGSSGTNGSTGATASVVQIQLLP